MIIKTERGNCNTFELFFLFPKKKEKSNEKTQANKQAKDKAKQKTNGNNLQTIASGTESFFFCFLRGAIKTKTNKKRKTYADDLPPFLVWLDPEQNLTSSDYAGINAGEEIEKGGEGVGEERCGDKLIPYYTRIKI